MPDVIRVAPAAGISVTIAAVADQTTLAAIALSATVTGGSSPYTYAWTASGSTTGFNDATSATPTFTPPGAGVYALRLTVTDAKGATGGDEEIVTVGSSGYWINVDPSTWTKVAGTASVVTALSAESVTLAATNADVEAEWDLYYGPALANGEYLISLEVLGVDTSTAVIMAGICNRADPHDAGGRFGGIGESAAGAVGLYVNAGGGIGTTALSCEKTVVHATVTNTGTKIVGNEVAVYGALGNLVGTYAISAGNTVSTVTTAGLAIIFARNGAPPAGPVTLAFRLSYAVISLSSEIG